MKHQLPKIWKKAIVSDLATVRALSCSEMREITKTLVNIAKCQPRSEQRMPKYKLPPCSCALSPCITSLK